MSSPYPSPRRQAPKANRTVRADIPGYLEGGDKEGSATFAQLTERAAQQCPDTQLVLAGYSQGAQLVHNGAAMIAPETAARVRAVVSITTASLTVRGG